MKTKTKVIFELVTRELGGLAVSFDSNTFKSKEEAEEHWKVNYKERKKEDNQDEYWNSIPCMIQKVTTQVEQLW